MNQDAETFVLTNDPPPKPKPSFSTLSQGSQLSLFRGLNDAPGQTEFGFIEQGESDEHSEDQS